MGASDARADYVRFQQEIASEALARGDVKEARRAVRPLRKADFVRDDLAEAHFGVLRDLRSEDDDVIAAIKKIVKLERVPCTSPSPNAPTRAMRILLVEDDFDASDALAAELTEAGHKVHACMSAVTARWILPRFEPEVVIVDIGLPVFDGNELAAYIRRRDGRVPMVVALTGVPTAARPELFDAVLSKPVDLSQLQHVLSTPRNPST